MLMSRKNLKNPFLRRLFLLAVAVLSGFAASGASMHSKPLLSAPSQDSTVLNPGAKLERELLPKQKHSYQITLAQGQYARVVAEQRGIDLVLRCFGIDGKVVAETDLESRLNGEEKLELVAEQAGAYRVEVEPRYKVFAAGRYTIVLAELRDCTETD